MDLLFCVQIAEFGMSRELQDENNYISHAEKIPIKWTAPEVSKLLILCICRLYNYRHYISSDTPLLVMCGVLV